MIVAFYIVKGDCAACFENSSTLIAVTARCLFGDLSKPLLAELGAKKRYKQITRGAKQAHKQAQCPRSQ